MRDFLKLRFGIAAALLCLLPLSARAAAADTGEPKILTKVNGQNLDDIVMSWLHWVGEEAPMIYPDDDKTGKGCAANQAGSVWYLIDNYTGAPAKRYCNIPSDKYIFVPIAVSSQTNHLGWKHCGEMLSDARKQADKAAKLTLEVDGKKLKDFKALKADSKYCSGLSLEGNVKAPGTYAAAGYWAVLPPLSAGKHIIRFGGDLYPSDDSSDDGDDSPVPGAAKDVRKPGDPKSIVEYQIVSAPDTNPDVKLLTKAEGKTLSDLAIAWADWAMSIPAAQDVRADKTGKFCAANQKGAIWQLSDAYYQFGDAEFSRKCTVPGGKYILIPVAHKIQQRNGADGYCDLLQKSVKKAMDGAVSLKLSVDGHNFGDFYTIRAASRDCHTMPGNAGIYAVDGYWALLPPLEKGEHIINFSSRLDGGPGRETAADLPIKPVQSMAVSYKLNVE